MIQVDNLTKTYGRVLAVDGVTFSIDKGEIVGFLGPNGAGKTTTLRILTTYLPATSGNASVAGHDVRTDSMAVRGLIGYLPESVPLYNDMRVEEYLDYRAKLKGVPRKGRLERLDYCLSRCRIREVRRRTIGTLSKGYRQRVGLADAMIHDPPILILDEPTVGLDPVQIRETLALIRELGERRTILLSTHILSEMEAVCGRVIMIAGGRLKLDKSLAELLTGSVIVVEASGPAEQVGSLLRGLEGVVSVAQRPGADGTLAHEVTTRDGADLREPISLRLSKNGWGIRRLDMQRRRLEDHFFDVMGERDPLRDPHRQPVGSSS